MSLHVMIPTSHYICSTLTRIPHVYPHITPDFKTHDFNELLPTNNPANSALDNLFIISTIQHLKLLYRPFCTPLSSRWIRLDYFSTLPGGMLTECLGCPYMTGYEPKLQLGLDSDRCSHASSHAFQLPVPSFRERAFGCDQFCHTSHSLSYISQLRPSFANLLRFSKSDLILAEQRFMSEESWCD